jgi:NADH-quinone oxidoreductase subunit J
MALTFYVAGAVAVLSTLLVITSVNAIHALLYLIVSLLAAAVVFFTLGAPFVAALEVIIYAGAIMVLFVFVVMILNPSPETTGREEGWLRPSTWVGPSLLAGVLGLELVYLLARGGGAPLAAEVVGPRAVSLALFGPYLLGVELASFLLLAGLVGAYHLGRRLSMREGDR